MTVEDVFYYNMTDAIFVSLHEKDNTLEYINTDNMITLDFDYYGRSASKRVAPLVKKLYTEQTNYKEILSSIILNRFKDKWDNIYNAITADYDILDNYNSIENEEINMDIGKMQVMTNDNTENRNNTRNLSIDVTGVDGTTLTGSITNNVDETVNSSSTGEQTSNNLSNNVDSFNAFNSSESKKTNEKDVTIDSTVDNTESNEQTTESEIKTLENNTIDNTSTTTTTDAGTVTDTNTSTMSGSVKDDTEQITNRTLTRKGNIGVTTSQQMLQSEIDLRNYDFYEMIFKDLDKLLTLLIY